MKGVPEYMDGDDLASLMLEVARWFRDHGAPLHAVVRLQSAAADIEELYDQIEELQSELVDLKMADEDAEKNAKPLAAEIQ